MSAISMVLFMFVMNSISPNSDKKVEGEYNYIYVAKLNSYYRLSDRDVPGRCIPEKGHYCSYKSKFDLGIIVTEQQLKKVHAIPGHHQGSYQLQ